MRFNPFQPNSLVTPGMFSGRVNEICSIEQSLFQTKHGNPHHFLIEGERGIGKSSLLYYVDLVSRGRIPAINGPSFNFITISTELSKSRDYYDIIRTLGKELKRVIGNEQKIKSAAAECWDFLTKWEVLGVRFHKSRQEVEPSELLDSFVSAIEQLCSETEGAFDGVLILIDEADAPGEDAELGELLKLLSEMLTKRQCSNVVIGITGLPILIQKLKASHESSARIFETLVLEPLEPEERIQVIRRGLSVAREKNGFSTDITDDALNLISHLSEGYPHFVQQFAYCAFNEDTDNTIDFADVAEGAYKENGALDQLGQKYFNDLFFVRISSDHYRNVLMAMAEHGDDWVSRAQIIKESGVKESNVTNALRALKDRNIIISNEAIRGMYKLPTRSFATWINAIKSAEEAAQQGRQPRLDID